MTSDRAASICVGNGHWPGVICPYMADGLFRCCARDVSVGTVDHGRQLFAYFCEF